MDERAVRVMVTSEWDVVSMGLLAALEPDPVFETAVGSIDVLREEGADVVLYDVEGLLGDAAGDFDRLVATDVAVLAVSRDLRPDLADAALARGADGCVSLRATAEEVVAAVKAAARGDLAGESSADAVDYTVNPASGGRSGVHLTPREAEVLRLIAAGLSNEEIAAALFLSINSVKTYIRGAYRRIDVRTRSQAVAWTIDHRLDVAPRD